jgi:hypothetical protein
MEGVDIQTVEFEVDFVEKEHLAGAENAFFIHGLTVKGLEWNPKTRIFDVCEGNALRPVPWVKLSATREIREMAEHEFVCPIYEHTGQKTETLLTTFRIATNSESTISLRNGAAFYVGEVSE